MEETYVTRSQGELTLLHLFFSFLRLGITAFGGPAMIAYIRKMVVIQKQWLDGETFQNGTALCQSIPGATVMQMVAYIGLRIRGVKGAVVSFIGFGLPAFLLMMIFSICYTSMLSLHKVTSALSGLQAIIIAVIANSAITKIDLLAFGGGFTSVPLMYHEVVEIHSWLDRQTFLNGIILGQFSPGPIVITATFVGYLMHGILGAFVATIAIFLPSFLLVIGVSPWFDRLLALPYFSRTINGILCSFIGLLIMVAIRFSFMVHWDSSHILLASAAFGALLLNIDLLWVVVFGSTISVFIF